MKIRNTDILGIILLPSSTPCSYSCPCSGEEPGRSCSSGSASGGPDIRNDASEIHALRGLRSRSISADCDGQSCQMLSVVPRRGRAGDAGACMETRAVEGARARDQPRVIKARARTTTNQTANAKTKMKDENILAHDHRPTAPPAPHWARD